MKLESVRVIVVRPGCAPTVETIAGDLQSLQTIVGGYIEFCRIEDRPGVVDLYCNEDGRRLQLPMNRDVPCLAGPMLGTFILASARPNGEDMSSFTDEEIAAWLPRVGGWAMYIRRRAR